MAFGKVAITGIRSYYPSVFRVAQVVGQFSGQGPFEDAFGEVGGQCPGQI